MRPFQVGDRFVSHDVGVMLEARWVDPADRYCAVVFNVANPFEDETVFAADFFDHWTLAVEDAPRRSAAMRRAVARAA